MVTVMLDMCSGKYPQDMIKSSFFLAVMQKLPCYQLQKKNALFICIADSCYKPNPSDRIKHIMLMLQTTCKNKHVTASMETHLKFSIKLKQYLVHGVGSSSFHIKFQMNQNA